MRSLLSAASLLAVAVAAQTSAPAPYYVGTKWFTADDCTGPTTGSVNTRATDVCNEETNPPSSAKEVVSNITYANISVFTPTAGDCSETPDAGYPKLITCGECYYEAGRGAFAINVCDIAGDSYQKKYDCTSTCSVCLEQKATANVGTCAHSGALMLHSLTELPTVTWTAYMDSTDCTSRVTGQTLTQCDTCYKKNPASNPGSSAMTECGVAAPVPTPVPTTTIATTTVAATTVAATTAANVGPMGVSSSSMGGMGQLGNIPAVPALPAMPAAPGTPGGPAGTSTATVASSGSAGSSSVTSTATVASSGNAGGSSVVPAGSTFGGFSSGAVTSGAGLHSSQGCIALLAALVAVAGF